VDADLADPFFEHIERGNSMAATASDGGASAPVLDAGDDGFRSSHWSTEKGQGRSFGVIYPRAYAESKDEDHLWRPRTEFLVQVVPGRCQTPLLDIRLQFSQNQECCCHPEGTPETRARWVQGDLCLDAPEDMAEVRELSESWREPLQREVKVSGLPLSMLLGNSATGVHEFAFCFPSTVLTEPVLETPDGTPRLKRRRQVAIDGRLEVGARPAGPDRYNIIVSVVNCTRLGHLWEPDAEAIALHTLADAYLLLDFSEPCGEDIANTIRSLHDSTPVVSVEVQ